MVFRSFRLVVAKDALELNEEEELDELRLPGMRNLRFTYFTIFFRANLSSSRLRFNLSSLEKIRLNQVLISSTDIFFRKRPYAF